MKPIAIILRAVFISPEFALIGLALALLHYCPNWFQNLSERIGHGAEFIKYTGALPAALLAFDAKTTRDILFCGADKKNILQSWPLYGSLKITCMVGLFYGIVFTVGGLAGMLFDWQHPAPFQSASLVIAICGAFAVSGTMYYAHISVEEHFRQSKSKL